MAEDPGNSPKHEPDPVSSTAKVGLLDQLTKAAAVLGAFFAAGQTGSQLIQSHYQAQQSLALEKQKSDSALASEFLKLILDKDTSDSKRSLLLNALSTLSSHPLQVWAKAQYAENEKKLEALEQARIAQLAAFELNGADREIRSLETGMTVLTMQMTIYRDDPEKSQALHLERTKLREKLAFAKSNHSLAEKKVALAASPSTAAAAAAVTFQLPVDRIRGVLKLPRGPELFNKYIPYIESGLAEFKLTDKSMIAAIIATAAYETNSFSTIVEYGSGEAYEGRADLGNVNPGDGKRFKGRGLIEITGRLNYARYSEKLGLGTLLVDSPDEAATPDVAARVLCVYFKEREQRFMTALSNSDLAAVWKLVVGGARGIDNFTKIYADVLAVL